MIDRILIADDEPLARLRLRELLAAFAPNAEYREAGNGDAAVEIIRSWVPQAVFLDIQMPGLDGFGVIQTITPERMPPTIFVTAYDEHAIDAFEVAAVDYLLKPFNDERFEKSWHRLLRAHASRALADDARRLADLLSAAMSSESESRGAKYIERFLVRIAERTYIVPIGDVRYMQSDGNYVDLFTQSGSHTIRETISHLEERLDPARFIRIHRRVIVALDQIKELQPWFAGDQILLLKDGTKLKVARTRREALATRLGGM